MNRFSWKLGQAFGIDMYLHYTFVLVPMFVLYSAWTSGAGFWIAAMTLVLTLSLFACVAMHELGHALMARYFGIGTRDIVMLPIGGIARLERMTRKPVEEFLISIAGPAVNLVIAALIGLGLTLFVGTSALLTPGFVGAGFWSMLMWANLLLVFFNMLPAFPMDGGRVFRAMLASFMPYYRATLVAGRTGQFVALLMVAVGLLMPWFSLALIGLFVAFMAQMEINAERNGMPVPGAVYRHPHPGHRPLPQGATVPASYVLQIDPGIQFFDTEQSYRVGRTPDGRYYVVRGYR